MGLAHITREEAVQRFARHHAGAPDSMEVLCELVRSEVHARKHAPRATILARVARLLAPVFTLDEQRLDEACDALEREGDVMLNPQGVLYATPTRVVALGHDARVFGSLPTRALAKAFGREVYAKGASRTIASLDDLAEVLAKVRGLLVSPEEWAGLDRSPNADSTFLEKLDHRLEWLALSAGSLERYGLLEWRALQVAPEGERWRRSAEGQLWWARTNVGGHHRVWTAGGCPSTHPFIVLSAEDADRARFALARSHEAPLIVRVERAGERVSIELPGWLPRAEYRWLSLHAVAIAESKGLRWSLPNERASNVLQVLRTRLGIESDANASALVTSSDERESTESRPDQGLGLDPVVHASPGLLDELLPAIKALGPLLQSLQVSTYRDLLAIDPDAVPAMPGIGKVKAAAFAELAAEARRRSQMLPLQSPVERDEQGGALPREQRFNYDDWNPRSVLGRLSKRVVNIIEEHSIDTVAQLKIWHREANPSRIDNYGQKTHVTLGELLGRLEAEGHEAIVFNGESPRSVNDMAERFLERFEDTEREILERRFVMGWTLEQIGDTRGLTRERIRQIVQRALFDYEPSWGPRAKELLTPALDALEARGGLAPTALFIDRQTSSTISGMNSGRRSPRICSR